jgi:chorismate mutase
VRVRAIRGATTCEENSRAEITAKAGDLVREMLARNGVELDDIVFVVLTSTDDLNAEFPAAGARAAGLVGVPLLGARELDVEGALERCIRALMLCYTERGRDEVRHVYLEGAVALPRELPE